MVGLCIAASDKAKPSERYIFRRMATGRSADVANLNAESFAEMLKSTATKEVTGSWRSGHYQGNWLLKGSQTKKLP